MGLSRQTIEIADQDIKDVLDEVTWYYFYQNSYDINLDNHQICSKSKIKSGNTSSPDKVVGLSNVSTSLPCR